MLVLILFAFIGGIITVLSPCILPVLPIILSGSLSGGKKRPLGIVTGFILSFTFFTLFLSTLVRLTGLSADSLRYVAIAVLLLFGASLLIPKFQLWMELFFSRLTSKLIKPTTHNAPPTTDYLSGIPVGASLGLLWTPCVGPIIASVITLAATSQVNGSAVLITLAYSLGTSLPMLAITYGGRQLLNKTPWIFSQMKNLQKGFGVLMILTAVGIFYNIDRTIQTAILTAFPQYGTGLTALEDNSVVKNALKQLSNTQQSSTIGKPMNEVQQNTSHSLPKLGKAPGFTNKSGEWINSDPLTLEHLKGYVVLVDFWTYTCINCIRTLPYIRVWNEKYKDKGLVIIGVHTPEFEFEKSLKNVTKAAKDFQLTYPIVQDNDFGIWRDYNNQYWPAKYLIDTDGFVRYTHFGEGDYDETEAAIQELLKETGTTVHSTIDNPDYTILSRTPELYLGYQRLDHFVSPENILKNKPQQYTSPLSVPKNNLAYTGTWTLGEEFARPQNGSSLVVHFDAKEVFLVMKPKNETLTGIVNVLLQDLPVTTDAGVDVINSTVTVNENRLYKLVNQEKAGPAILKLEFKDDNVEVFAFTFG